MTSVTATAPSGGATPQSVATRQRRDVSSLLPRQLADLREAFRKVQGLSDDRGYQFHAGVHGLPLPKYCKIAHGRPLFLPWHRAYLYVFELALIRQVPTASLPWWAWTRVRKIPRAYDDAKQPDGKKNPLESVRINALALAQGARDPQDEEAHWLAQFPDTFRKPGAPRTPPLPSAARVKNAIDNLGDFLDFQDELEQMHNDVHVWVGGHMGDIPFASYDPIFWAHHAMVDRIWRLWQLKHPSAPMPFLDTALPPFSLTVRQTLDVILLGYDYAVTTTHDPGRP